MSEILLSICIPTYNRVKTLDRTLSTLAKEIEGIEDLVEICVSDNGSTDETPTILKKWAEKLPLTYSRNKTNCGYDWNVIAVTKLASGEYIWLSADDDIFFPSSLVQLINAIKTTKDTIPGAIYLSPMISGKWVDHFNFTKFKIFKTSNLMPPLCLGFIGSTCLNRSIAIGVLNKTVQFSKNAVTEIQLNNLKMEGFIHAYLFLECIKDSPLGILPNFGIISVGDPKDATYKRKFTWELATLHYNLKLQKYYPWFRFPMHRISIFIRLFGLAAIAAEKPIFEHPYLVYSNNHALLFYRKNMQIENFLVKAFNSVRSFFPISFGLIYLHKFMRKNLRSELSVSDDPVVVLPDFNDL